MFPRRYFCGQVHTIITVKVDRRGTISADTRSFRFGATATTHKFTAFFSGDRTGVMSIHHAARWDYVTTLLSSLSHSALEIHRHPLGFARGAASYWPRIGGAATSRDAARLANHSAPAGAVRSSLSGASTARSFIPVRYYLAGIGNWHHND